MVDASTSFLVQLSTSHEKDGLLFPLGRRERAQGEESCPTVHLACGRDDLHTQVYWLHVSYSFPNFSSTYNYPANLLFQLPIKGSENQRGCGWAGKGSWRNQSGCSPLLSWSGLHNLTSHHVLLCDIACAGDLGGHFYPIVWLICPPQWGSWHPKPWTQA